MKQEAFVSPRTFVRWERALALTALLLLGMLPVSAQTVPSLPTPSATESEPLFAAQIAGRQSLADAVSLCVTTPHLSYTAKWSVVTQDEANHVTLRTGTETLIKDTKAQRLLLVSETNPGPRVPKSATRFVSDGSTLLTAQFQQPLPKQGQTPTPTRTYFYVPISGDVETLTDALLTAKAPDAPLTQVARLSLLSPLDNNGSGWRGRGYIYTDTNGNMIEELPIDTNPRRTISVLRRYKIAAKTHLITTAEEWIRTRTKRGNKEATRTQYQREDYDYKPATGPERTDRFVTKPAPGYTETSPPSGVRLPDLPGPDNADERSRALLARWQRSWVRLTAYNAQIILSSQSLARTPESRPVPPRDAAQQGVLTVQLRRPARLYAVLEPAPGNPPAQARPFTAVSDGQTVALYDGAPPQRKRTEARINGNVDLLRNPLRLDERTDTGLQWLLTGPVSVFANATQAEYRGNLPLPDGSVVEAVTLTQTSTQNASRRRQRNGGTTQSTTLTTIYFNPTTGLPLRLERYISTTIEGRFERDNPPYRYLAADYTSAQVGNPIAIENFTLPNPPRP